MSAGRQLKLVSINSATQINPFPKKHSVCLVVSNQKHTKRPRCLLVLLSQSFVLLVLQNLVTLFGVRRPVAAFIGRDLSQPQMTKAATGRRTPKRLAVVTASVKVLLPASFARSANWCGSDPTLADVL